MFSDIKGYIAMVKRVNAWSFLLSALTILLLLLAGVVGIIFGLVKGITWLVILGVILDGIVGVFIKVVSHIDIG